MSRVRAQRRAILSLSLCVLAISSCQRASESTPSQPVTDTVTSTTPPFQTREPERYLATRTVTIISPGGDRIVTTTLIARDGQMRREEHDTASIRVVHLESAETRVVLLPDQKLYADSAGGGGEGLSSSEPEENSPDLLLHTDPITTTYQALGTETISGRSAAKYRVVVNNPATGNVSSNEMLIWIDTALNLPIKSETRSTDGTLVLMELSGVALNPDKQLFQIPAGYEKIAFSALQKQLKAAPLNP